MISLLLILLSEVRCLEVEELGVSLFSTISLCLFPEACILRACHPDLERDLVLSQSAHLHSEALWVCRKTFSTQVFYTDMVKKKPFKKDLLKFYQHINTMSNIFTIATIFFGRPTSFRWGHQSFP